MVNKSTPESSGKAAKNARTVKKAASLGRRKKGNGKGQRGRLGSILFGVLVGLAALAIAFFIYVKVQGEISLPENAVGSLVTPVQGFVSNATGWVRDRVNDLMDTSRLRSAYDQLQVENMQLQYQLSQLEEEARENDRLTALLDAQSRYDTLDPIYAKVIAKDTGRWFDIFAINRGSLSGVVKGMAVISADGLVGRVYEAGLNYAKVVCIISADSAVSCLIERTRDNGIMRGQLSAASDDDSCRMYYVPSVNDIMPGDSVVSSGLDGVYPKGLVVGTVTEVSRQSDTSDQYLVVKPAADFQHIEEVLVLRTVIETVGEDKAPLPTATTRAKPTDTPDPNATPVPAEYALPTNAPNDWAYPTSTPDPNATRAPVTLGDFLEDIWANS
ncbi:MAG: rod shape-determining protein MreC [Clostridia bacterium]|nr:rod shape-determining protein MreC [Clostridia bacterium]MBR4442868.1 rod shape-determining protein MreC [Clostridia bacterium]